MVRNILSHVPARPSTSRRRSVGCGACAPHKRVEEGRDNSDTGTASLELTGCHVPSPIGQPRLLRSLGPGTYLHSRRPFSSLDPRFRVHPIARRQRATRVLSPWFQSRGCFSRQLRRICSTVTCSRLWTHSSISGCQVS